MFLAGYFPAVQSRPAASAIQACSVRHVREHAQEVPLGATIGIGKHEIAGMRPLGFHARLELGHQRRRDGNEAVLRAFVAVLLSFSRKPRSGFGWMCTLAEREGFEPPIPLRVCRISSAVVSTTHPPLRRVAYSILAESPLLPQRHRGFQSLSRPLISVASLLACAFPRKRTAAPRSSGPPARRK